MAQARVALLRAINLGKRNKVPMAELRRVFEEAGCRSVRTYIQSGNVIFEHEAPDRAALEAAVAKAFGFETAIVIRTARQMRDLAAARPFGPDTSTSYVAFLADRPDQGRLRALPQLDTAPDEVAPVGRDIAVRYSEGVQRAQVTVARLEKLLDVPATLRNWRTVTRLAELAALD